VKILKHCITFLGLFLVLVACSGTNENREPTFTPRPTFTPPPTSTPVPRSTLPPAATIAVTAVPFNEIGSATVRIVQGNSGLDVVDVYWGQQAVAARFRYGGVSSIPVDVRADTNTLRVVSAGADNTSENALYETEFTLDVEQNVILSLQGNNPETLFIDSFVLDLSPLDANIARATVVNATGDVENLAVITSDFTLGEDLQIGEMADPLELPIDSYSFAFLADAGTLNTTEQVVEAQQHYSLIFFGTAPTYQTAVIAEPASPQAFVRVVHTSYDTPPVNVYIGEQLLAENLAFGENTPDFAPSETGSFTIRLESARTADQGAILSEQIVTLNTNGQYHLLVMGRFVNLRVGLFEVSSEPITGQYARLQVINAYPDLDSVSGILQSVVPPSAIDNFEPPVLTIPFGQVSETNLINIGQQNYSFTALNRLDNTELPLLTTDSYTIEAGKSYTLILMGRDGQATNLYDVDVSLKEAPILQENVETTQVRFVNLLDETISVSVGEFDPLESIAPDSDSTLLTTQENVGYPVTVMSNDGREILTSEVFTRDTISTFYIAESDEEVFVYENSDPIEVPFSNVGRVSFFFLVPDITISYQLQPESNTTSAIPNSAVPTIAPVLISETFAIGDIEFVDFAAGIYDITIYNGLTGELLDVFELVLDGEQQYDVVLRGTHSDLELVAITRTQP